MKRADSESVLIFAIRRSVVELQGGQTFFCLQTDTIKLYIYRFCYVEIKKKTTGIFRFKLTFQYKETFSDNIMLPFLVNFFNSSSSTDISTFNIEQEETKDGKLLRSGVKYLLLSISIILAILLES